MRRMFRDALGVGEEVFDPIVPSPKEYHYRHRVDLRLLRTKSGEIFIGFTPEGKPNVVPIQACPISMPAVSDSIPRVKEEAVGKLKEKHRNANLVVRTGDDGRVLWGGVGRRSLRLEEADYLWTEVEGRRIHFSLDTFFQANLSILPALMDNIRSLAVLDHETVLLDLYGGVGLFGVVFHPAVKKTILIESDVHSVRLAQHNKGFHHMDGFEVVQGRVEEALPSALAALSGEKITAMIDPPRAGLSETALECVASSAGLNRLLYLSCHPETLVRDLAGFCARGWTMSRVIPFDFFPKTRHLETLVLLRR